MSAVESLKECWSIHVESCRRVAQEGVKSWKSNQLSIHNITAVEKQSEHGFRLEYCIRDTYLEHTLSDQTWNMRRSSIIQTCNALLSTSGHADILRAHS
ncbi:hypothetical protein MRB53_040805 [Persea americana]|nr:hypothetical protein MRB53_040805 [Persea americana]